MVQTIVDIFLRYQVSVYRTIGPLVLFLQPPEYIVVSQTAYEPRCEKTGLRGFRPGPTKTGLCNHRRWLEA